VSAHSGGVGKGATFTVRFPGSNEGRARIGLSVVGGGSLTSRTILIVEDNADERASLRMLLEMHGHRVLEAADGRAAIDLLRTVKPPIAVVDIGLPGLDGYEVARTARRELGREIVLVALTGYGSAEDEQRSLQAGFDRHVTKPVGVHELMQAIGGAKRAA
jgi:CheY-like chemotaxis protein